MRYRVMPYRQGSKGARALADALGGRVLRLEGSTFQKKPNDVIINWGNTNPHKFQMCDKNAVDLRYVTNKLNFFKAIKEAGHENLIPRFWTNQSDIPDDAYPIVCRTELAGHSGAGIVIAETAADLVPAPLYVQYMKKKEEYRIHVGLRNGEPVIIAKQRKARRLATPDSEVNWKVRNLTGGFVFVREGFIVPDSVIEAASDCLRSSGIDFGAVDIGWHPSKGPIVYEINSAPGLEGSTVMDYANFFKSLT